MHSLNRGMRTGKGFVAAAVAAPRKGYCCCCCCPEAARGVRADRTGSERGRHKGQLEGAGQHRPSRRIPAGAGAGAVGEGASRTGCTAVAVAERVGLAEKRRKATARCPEGAGRRPSKATPVAGVDMSSDAAVFAATAGVRYASASCAAQERRKASSARKGTELAAAAAGVRRRLRTLEAGICRARQSRTGCSPAEAATCSPFRSTSTMPTTRRLRRGWRRRTDC